MKYGVQMNRYKIFKTKVHKKEWPWWVPGSGVTVILILMLLIIYLIIMLPWYSDFNMYVDIVYKEIDIDAITGGIGQEVEGSNVFIRSNGLYIKSVNLTATPVNETTNVLETGINIRMSPPSIKPGEHSTAKITISTNVTSGEYVINYKAESNGKNRSCSSILFIFRGSEERNHLSSQMRPAVVVR